ncbi:MAG: RIP metalloprotease RseP [Verrucomicrobia bacterium]|nr:RIP metalloprotease RseP [Verrucomicrobiota bacterium]
MYVLKVIFICLEVLVLFNLLIFVHELGHFLAARWRGLKVERFAIWFGKPMWKTTVNGVEYCLGCIPAGGYVSLPQMASMEAIEGKTKDQAEQLPPISALDKIIVALAGPLFSFLLALGFAVVVMVVGRPVTESEATTVIGYVEKDGPADKAGLRPGDRILEVDGQPVTKFGGMGSSVTWRVVRSEGQTIPVKVQRGAEVLNFDVTPMKEATKAWERKSLRQIRIGPAQSAIVAEVATNGPAYVAGLQTGDRILAVNGQPLYHVTALGEFIEKHPGEKLTLQYERQGEKREVTLLPELALSPTNREPWMLFPDDLADVPALAAKLQGSSNALAAALRAPLSDKTRQLLARFRSDDSDPRPLATALAQDLNRFLLGVSLYEPQRFTGITLSEQTRQLLQTQPQGPELVHLNRRLLEDAFPGEIERNYNDRPRVGLVWDLSRYQLIKPGAFDQMRDSVNVIVATFDALFSRKSDIKPQHLGGAVKIINVYYTLFDSEQGWRLALWFSVVLNVNLALLNLLPFPVLDGGHIVLATIEAIRRKPVHAKLLNALQTACAVLLIGYMLYIAFFDVQELPWKRSKEKEPPAMRFAPKPEAAR